MILEVYNLRLTDPVSWQLLTVADGGRHMREDNMESWK